MKRPVPEILAREGQPAANEDSPMHTPFNVSSPTVKHGNGQRPVLASGRNLRRLLRGKKAATRARVAAMLVTGEYQLVRPLPTQAARLVGVNPGRVSSALGNVGQRGPRNTTIDRLIAKYGAEAILRGLDRATAPGSSAPTIQAAE
jgi:hypothetical protein